MDVKYKGVLANKKKLKKKFESKPRFTKNQVKFHCENTALKRFCFNDFNLNQNFFIDFFFKLFKQNRNLLTLVDKKKYFQ